MLVAAVLLLVAAVLLMVAANARLEAQAGANAASRPPFRIFDNLYYVGIDVVSAYLVPTDDGLIVIDALFADSADQLLDNVRALGFDPADIRYLLVSHGHGDHAAGAPRIREVTGARVGMTAEDWDMTGETPDLTLVDGQSITLGGTTFEFFVTPGHTPGVLSMRFPVVDGNDTYTAFMFGGMGLNFSGVERTQMYLRSVRRVQQMDGIEVNITNHEGAGRIYTRADVLQERRPGDPHPFVDPDGFTAWLDQLETNAEAKLAEERAAANN
jgi:metallo-beta-lactamase class B